VRGAADPAFHPTGRRIWAGSFVPPLILRQTTGPQALVRLPAKFNATRGCTSYRSQYCANDSSRNRSESSKAPVRSPDRHAGAKRPHRPIQPSAHANETRINPEVSRPSKCPIFRISEKLASLGCTNIGFQAAGFPTTRRVHTASQDHRFCSPIKPGPNSKLRKKTAAIL